MPTVAFDFHETLWAEHSSQRRAGLVQGLYLALHAAGWRVIVVTWAANPIEDRPRDRQWRLDTFAGLNLPEPSAFHICYEDGKGHILESEGVDLLIDDNYQWITDAHKRGICTLYPEGG